MKSNWILSIGLSTMLSAPALWAQAVNADPAQEQIRTQERIQTQLREQKKEQAKAKK